MLVQIFNTILYQPLFNLLVFFYNLVPGNDIGLAIILASLIIARFVISKLGQVTGSMRL